MSSRSRPRSEGTVSRKKLPRQKAETLSGSWLSVKGGKWKREKRGWGRGGSKAGHGNICAGERCQRKRATLISDTVVCLSYRGVKPQSDVEQCVKWGRKIRKEGHVCAETGKMICCRGAVCLWVCVIPVSECYLWESNPRDLVMDEQHISIPCRVLRDTICLWHLCVCVCVCLDVCKGFLSAQLADWPLQQHPVCLVAYARIFIHYQFHLLEQS